MITLLRTLTMKSKWSYTQNYQGKSVEEILKIHPSTIYWVYCFKPEITFNEEVLGVLEVLFENFKRIDKPNVDHEQFEKQFSNLWDRKSYKELKDIITTKKMNNEPIPPRLLEVFHQKRMVRSDNIYSKIVYTKGQLKSMNQGKSIY